jgi:flagellar motor protein MotB
MEDRAMKPTRTLAACLALALPLAAWSQDTASSPTRAEVKQQGQQALKQGQTPVGDKLPDKPSAGSSSSTTTRTQVKHEAAAAASAGAIPQGEVGARPRDTNPKKYGASSPTSSKSRAQVKSEAHEANREGDIPTGDLGKGSGADIANKPSNRKAAKAASAASM